MLKRPIVSAIFLFVFFAVPKLSFAQPTWTLDPFGKEKKPQKFENRTLGSERTADKKFTTPRHLLQNTVTHYNYYFNANNKVNNIVERAKISHKDDYTKLLSFYPYDLENTASQKKDLDSILLTCTAGILIHDLRNDWIDNLYLLIGKSYYYQKIFDSAAMTFQFINYNLFPRKKHDDDDRIVGTNSSASGSKISIANHEKRNLLQKILTLPPSRNDALVWLARTLIEQEEFGESGSLINTLQNDPNLPKRLRNDLDEVAAYWYYRQAGYDSTASHLERALSNADSKQDKSRWEFMLAQLYEMNHQYAKASDYYKRAAKHTVEPLMDIYASLNEAKMMKGTGNPKELEKSIDNLAKMAKKDKYESYRDIIYYSAGQLSLQKPDTTEALVFFNKSVKYNSNNISFKNKAFLQLADIAYSQKRYRQAASLYDSLQMGDTTLLASRKEQIETRKTALSKIVDAITNIEREDSLQRIAAMSAAERDDFIKKLVRKLRKEQGLKEDNSGSGAGDIIPFNNNQQAADLFADYSKGDWYFYNSSLKSRGFNEFKSKWGNRANVDNWRRAAGMQTTQIIAGGNPDTKTPGKPNEKTTTKGNNNSPVEISYEALMKDIPLNALSMAKSNDTLAASMFELAKLYQNELEEYELAANTYEEYLKRFPEKLADGEVYLGLFYCYSKLGNLAKADYYKNLLTTGFPKSRAAQMANNPGSLNPKVKDPEATRIYEAVYNLFIEGNFEKAVEEKKKADALYGVNYWTPQLLYIEALYNVKQQNDSLAISGLKTLMASYPNSPLKAKATTMIDVLKRRKEIETYLTNLQITRDTAENKINIQSDNKPIIVRPKPITPVVKDSVKKEPAPLVNGTFSLLPNAPQMVMMILEKVDGVYVNEAKNALSRYSQEKFWDQHLTVAKENLDADHNLLLISSFTNATEALKYYDKIKKDAKNEVSWLPPAKYSFLIISKENLDQLKLNKNLSAYKNLLNTQFPARF